MAKKSQGADSVDELLGTETVNNEVKDSKPRRTPEEIKADIEKAQEMLKGLRQEAKGKDPKPAKELKGQYVTFKTKNGTEITGLGVEYIVARMNGKLYYKEKSSVHFLTQEEIDALPAELKVK